MPAFEYLQKASRLVKAHLIMARQLLHGRELHKREGASIHILWNGYFQSKSTLPEQAAKGNDSLDFPTRKTSGTTEVSENGLKPEARAIQ